MVLKCNSVKSETILAKFHVCRLSVVGNTRAPYSGGCNFRQYFYCVWYVGHPLTSAENYGDRPRGTPPPGELNTRGVAKYSDFDLSKDISRKRCKIRGKLVLITNRKQCFSQVFYFSFSFRLVD